MNDDIEKKKLLMEKFKIAVNIQDNYNNLFWTRTTVFFAINTALFAGYGLVVTEILKLLVKPDTLPQEARIITAILVIFGIVGALLSWRWQKIHERATFLQEYYRFRASVIEESIGIEPEIFGKSYAIASTKKTWDEIYGNEGQKIKEQWEKLFLKLTGKKWKDEKDKDPGSLRHNLNLIYGIFVVVWIALSVIGVLIMLIILTS